MLPKVFLDNMLYDEIRSMSSDIYLKDGVYYVDIDLPGYTKEEINIEFHKGTITIKAEMNVNDDTENKKYIRHERRYHNKTRSFYFSDIDEDNIKAELVNGVLHLTIPQKTEMAKKQINID